MGCSPNRNFIETWKGSGEPFGRLDPHPLLLNEDSEVGYRSIQDRIKVVENETQDQVIQSHEQPLEHPLVVT